jgi:hypothetical protein
MIAWVPQSIGCGAWSILLLLFSREEVFVWAPSELKPQMWGKRRANPGCSWHKGIVWSLYACFEETVHLRWPDEPQKTGLLFTFAISKMLFVGKFMFPALC